MPTRRPPKAATAAVRPKSRNSSENKENAKPVQKNAVAGVLKTKGNALAKLEEEASRGLEAYVQPIEIKNKWEQASDPKLAEREELADLAFMGIKGRTPGGSRWRTRVTGKETIAPMAVLSEETHI